MKHYEIEAYEPTEEQKEAILAGILADRKKLHYRKTADGFETFCLCCGDHRNITTEDMRRIKASNLCPNCHNQVRFGLTEYEAIKEYVLIPELRRNCNEKAGYIARVRWNFERSSIALQQVLHVDPLGTQYRNGIVKGMMGQIYETETGGWLKCRTGSNYYGYCLLYSDYFRQYTDEPKTKTRRQHYKSIPESELLKPNQREFVKRSLFNENQIRYIVTFNLKSEEEVLKHQTYMKKNPIRLTDHRLNTTHLEYLKRNKIPAVDYLDYADDCRILGFKPGKPKDFEYRHQRYSEMARAKLKEQETERIRERAKELTTFKGKTVRISPFTSAAQIIKAGKTLHNCIGSYIERYSNGETDLFCIRSNGTIIGAIELQGMMIVQARGDRNKDIRDMPEVGKWYKKVIRENNERIRRNDNERNSDIPQTAA